MMLITIILIICTSICNGSIPSKLKGGMQVDIERYPYVVSLQWREKHLCGGSIISPDTIITSANCVVIETVPLIYQSNLQVLVGADNNVIHNGDGVIHAVRLIIAHENYEPRASWVHDLALLKLESPIVPFSGELKTLKISQRTIRLSKMTTLGWGGTNELHKLFMDSQSLWDCHEIFNYIVFTTNSKGCATADRPETSVVFGDSGNPLIQNNFIVGVISVFDPLNPGNILFTKTYGYRHWIRARTEVY